MTEILPFPAPQPGPGRPLSAPDVPLSTGEAEALRWALVAAVTAGPTLATVAANLQALAKADIRNAPPSARPYEPFRCHRCNDLKTVPDWANWQPAWLWQRYRPVPRIPCPGCAGGVGPDARA